MRKHSAESGEIVYRIGLEKGTEIIYWKCVIQIYSGITHGRVLNRELYTQREIFMKQAVDKYK